MLFYILVPLCIVWILSYVALWFKGHYPLQWVYIHILIFVASLWMCYAVKDTVETPLLYVGTIMPISASVLWVPATLYLAKTKSNWIDMLWKILLALQVVGYLILCIAFCMLNTAVNACVCGICLVLNFVYVDKIYNSSGLSDSNIALLSISI